MARWSTPTSTTSTPGWTSGATGTRRSATPGRVRPRRGRRRVLRGPRRHDGRGLVAAALLAAAAPGRLAGEAAALPRLLPARARRPVPGQGPPRRARRRPGGVMRPTTPDPDKSVIGLAEGSVSFR